MADASSQGSVDRKPPPEKLAEIIIQSGPKNQIPNNIHDAIDARLEGASRDRNKISIVNTAVIIDKSVTRIMSERLAPKSALRMA